MEPWYKVVTPREEVREGRSFNPDEFAIALEQVVAGKAPSDYVHPDRFFSRTCFTKALRTHAGMVMRRLSGKTENSAPVLTLVTQFGGGKTHTLATLYHLAHSGEKAAKFDGIPALLDAAGLEKVPSAKVAIFVGNAWDPHEGRETPWIDIARQLAGDRGVELLGKAAEKTPPGTETLGRVFEAAGGPVLILCDEVLNFINRHRGMAEPFHAFIQNLTVAMTGTTRGAAVISLPRSQVEMTDWDLKWQEKINKVVRRVAKDLIVNDEAEIGEVVRRRLFESLGGDRARKTVARTYADWCFERRAQLPPEWTAVDSAATEASAREYLRERFETCYPFHPATLSVFQRKWQVLPQYQQTRGTLAMLAQWVSWAFSKQHREQRPEALITLGSAPLHVAAFRSVVLGQLGEPRLGPAIEVDVAGVNSKASALDADTSGPLREIHRRVGAAILFESSGGQQERVAHLPELRFALAEPGVDTTSVDNAAMALESKAFHIRKVGSDGFQIRHLATLRKKVSNYRASLDPEREVRPTMRRLVEEEFKKGASLPVLPFPEDGAAVPDSPKLTLVVVNPEDEWVGNGPLREQVAGWTKRRGKSDRLYPGALVWCIRKPGRDFQECVENMLAWKRVQKELGGKEAKPSKEKKGEPVSEFEDADPATVQAMAREAEGDAREAIWATYRYLALSDAKETDGLQVIDLGEGHSSGMETLAGRVISAMKSHALLNEGVGVSYIDRNWPSALKESGAWPLTGLRQSFLNGSLTRLLDPDTVLKVKIVEFVGRGDFGLASGARPDGSYERLWFGEFPGIDEVAFDAGVFLLTKARAKALQGEGLEASSTPAPSPPGGTPEPAPGPVPPEPPAKACKVRLAGSIPPEVWNRLGSKVIPKLRTGSDLRVDVEFSANLGAETAPSVLADLRQILDDLGLQGSVRILEE